MYILTIFTISYTGDILVDSHQRLSLFSFTLISIAVLQPDHHNNGWGEGTILSHLCKDDPVTVTPALGIYGLHISLPAHVPAITVTLCTVSNNCTVQRHEDNLVFDNFSKLNFSYFFWCFPLNPYMLLKDISRKLMFPSTLKSKFAFEKLLILEKCKKQPILGTF